MKFILNVVYVSIVLRMDLFFSLISLWLSLLHREHGLYFVATLESEKECEKDQYVHLKCKRTDFITFECFLFNLNYILCNKHWATLHSRSETKSCLYLAFKIWLNTQIHSKKLHKIIEQNEATLFACNCCMCMCVSIVTFNNNK